MQIKFDSMDAEEIPNFMNGEGSVLRKMYRDDAVKVMQFRVRPGNSVGLHTHSENREVVYIISGKGKTVCDGKEDVLLPGTVTYCPRGSSHTIINDGGEDLVFFSVVPSI